METFELYREGLVLPDIRGLGWCDTHRPRLGGRRQDGLNFLEIGYLHRGSVEWLTETGLTEAGPGSVLIDWPGDWQGGETALIHPCERFWLRLDLDDLPGLPGLEGATGRALQAAFRSMDRRHFPAPPIMHAWFSQLLEQQRRPTPFGCELSRAALHQILFTLVNAHSRIGATPPAAPVGRALDYVAEHLSEEIRVGDLAALSGLSAGHFHEMFLRDTGLTPARYLLDRRIAEARGRLVRSDEPVTAIGLDLGFSTSQYFATAFKRRVGLTPGAYRRLRRPGGRTETFSDLARSAG